MHLNVQPETVSASPDQRFDPGVPEWVSGSNKSTCSGYLSRVARLRTNPMSLYQDVESALKPTYGTDRSPSLNRVLAKTGDAVDFHDVTAGLCNAPKKIKASYQKLLKLGGIEAKTLPQPDMRGCTRFQRGNNQ